MKMPEITGRSATTVIVLVAATFEISSSPQNRATTTA